MRSSLVVCLAVAMILATARVAAAYEPHPAVYSTQQIHADFDVFESALREMHGGLHVHASRGEVDAMLAEARRDLGSAETEDDLLLVLARVVSAVGDGHTSVRMSGAATEFFERQSVYLPLRLVHLGGETFVRHDLSGTDTSRAGHRVERIDGRAMGGVLRELSRHVPGDGRNLTGRHHRLSDPSTFGRLYQRRFGPSTAFAIEFASGETVDYEAISGPELDRRYQEADPDHYEGRGGGGLDFQQGIPVLRVSTFFGRGYADFVTQAFAEIADSNATSLVLDLRGNGGGLENYGQQLVAHLVAEPFSFYARATVNARQFALGRFSANNPSIFADDEAVATSDGRFELTPKRRQFLAPHDPVADPFDGRLVVLVDGGTFSTAADVVTALDRYRDVVFVGEEVGGNYYGNTSGSTKTIYLPHTKVRVRIPVERYDTVLTGERARDRGLVPEVRALRSIEDRLSGEDTPLRHALERAWSGQD